MISGGPLLLHLQILGLTEIPKMPAMLPVLLSYPLPFEGISSPAWALEWGVPPWDSSTLGWLAQECALTQGSPPCWWLAVMILAQKANLYRWDFSLGIANQSDSDSHGDRN